MPDSRLLQDRSVVIEIRLKLKLSTSTLGIILLSRTNRWKQIPSRISRCPQVPAITLSLSGYLYYRKVLRNSEKCLALGMLILRRKRELQQYLSIPLCRDKSRFLRAVNSCQWKSSSPFIFNFSLRVRGTCLPAPASIWIRRDEGSISSLTFE